MANAIYQPPILDCRVLVDGKWVDALCVKSDRVWHVQRSNFPHSQYIYYLVEIGSDEIRFPKRYRILRVLEKRSLPKTVAITNHQLHSYLCQIGLCNDKVLGAAKLKYVLHSYLCQIGLCNIELEQRIDFAYRVALVSLPNRVM